MKNNADKVIQEKLGAIDTLGGGIVYGKEEAWEKLQVRMDRKPAKIVALKYAAVAAAVLLLMVYVTGMYYYPAKQLPGTLAHKEINTTPPNTLTIAPNAASSEPAKPATVDDVKVKSTKTHTGHTVQHEDVPAVITGEKPEELATNLNITDPVMPAVPAQPNRKLMRVVHINELGSDVQRTPAAITEHTAGVDVRLLPIVQMNDVLHDEYEVEQLRKENRFSDTHHLFPHQRTDLYTEQQDDATGYQPLFKQRSRIN